MAGKASTCNGKMKRLGDPNAQAAQCSQVVYPPQGVKKAAHTIDNFRVLIKQAKLIHG